MTRKDMTRRARQSLALVCIGALLAPPLVWAGINPQPFRTGLFGITPGQAIRVSVLNSGNIGGTIAPCFNPDLAGFVVTLSGPAGRVLFESHHKTLLQGVGTFTDFTPVPDDNVTAIGARVPGDGAVVRARRAQMRAEVAIELLPVPEDGRCADDAVARRQARRLLRHVHLTLEVFDVATGRTEFTMPFARVAGVDPTPF